MERNAEIVKRITGLPRRARLIVMLRYADNLTLQEIASVLSVPAATVLHDCAIILQIAKDLLNAAPAP